MRKGGIIFYSIYDKDMIAVGNGQKNWALDYYVDAFKSVAPAKMFVCMTFEAEFLMHNNPSGRTSYASPAEYRQCALHAPQPLAWDGLTSRVPVPMCGTDWQYTRNYFEANGVTNAIWAMDFSTQAAWAEWHPLYAAMCTTV